MKEFDFKHFVEYLKEMLKKEYILTRIMIRILIKMLFLKKTMLKRFVFFQFFNTLKMILVFIIFMLPMGSWLIVLLVVLKFKFNINLLPSSFDKEKYIKSLKRYHAEKLKIKN